MRLIGFLFLIVIAISGYLAYLNPGEVTFYLTQDKGFNIPTTALVLLSMAFGGLIVALVTGYIETKHLFVTWRTARSKKRDERIAGYLREGLNAKVSQRYQEAIDSFQKVLQIEPNHVTALVVLGDIHRTQGNLQEALPLHWKAKELDEENIEALLSLFESLKEARRIDEAIQVLKGVLKVDKECLPARIRLRELYVGLNRWEKAHETQEKIMKRALPPKEVKNQQGWLEGIKYEIGREFLKQGHLEEAQRYFRGCLKLNKNFIAAYVDLGEVALTEGKVEEASKLWEKAYEVTGHVLLLHRLEEHYLSIGQPDRILRVYQRATQRDPANRVLQFYLGKLYYRLEMVDEAFETLNMVDSEEGRIPDLHKMLGNLYLRKGEGSSAVEEFKKALGLKKRVLVPYYCPPCDFHATRWSGRCSRCGRWKSFEASPVMEKGVKVKTVAKTVS